MGTATDVTGSAVGTAGAGATGSAAGPGGAGSLACAAGRLLRGGMPQETLRPGWMVAWSRTSGRYLKNKTKKKQAENSSQRKRLLES